ncbi:MAG: transporter substrate-binding domain-containing protein [Thiolinea sp.]
MVELIPMLNDGLADMIVTNLTYTETRAEQVAFSQAVNQVDEWLIHQTGRAAPDLDEGSFIIAVPDGTAYLETANELARAAMADITVRILPAYLSDDAVLNMVRSDENSSRPF